MTTKRRSPQQGGEKKMRRLFGSIDDDVHKALRLYAAEKDMEMQEVIEEALRKFLGLKGGEREKK
jgi:hypothetical protein